MDVLSLQSTLQDQCSETITRPLRFTGERNHMLECEERWDSISFSNNSFILTHLFRNVITIYVNGIRSPSRPWRARPLYTCFGEYQYSSYVYLKNTVLNSHLSELLCKHDSSKCRFLKLFQIDFESIALCWIKYITSRQSFKKRQCWKEIKI